MPVINGKAIQIRAISPIAMSQNGRDLQKLMQDYQMRAQMYGPQVATSMYQMEELHPWLIEKMGLETKLFKSSKEIVQSMEQQAQQMMMMQQQAQQPV